MTEVDAGGGPGAAARAAARGAPGGDAGSARACPPRRCRRPSLQSSTGWRRCSRPWRTSSGRLPEIDRRRRSRLLALLDDVGSLTETLREEQARLAVQLRAAGDHRRAGTAYRRASRL